jgi:hypothetical protein
MDIMRIAVHIAMSSNAAQVLGAIAAHFTGLNNQAHTLANRLGTVRMAALLAGAAIGTIGFAGAEFLVDATKKAEKLNDALVRLQIGALKKDEKTGELRRYTDAEMEVEKKNAFALARQVPGSAVDEIVKQKRELYGVFGDMKEVEQVQKEVAQGSIAVSRYTDKQQDLAQIAVKALELRGHIQKDGKVNPEEFHKEFDSMVRAIVSSEGLIDPQKILAFVSQAGPAARNMSTEEMWGLAPAIMNALGASKAGTAMMSTFSQFVGHIVAGKRTAVAMEQAHMLTPGKWSVGRGGKIIMDKDAVPDQERMATHPIEWMHEKMEALRNKYRNKKTGVVDDTAVTKVIQDIFQIASRATTARMMSEIDANWAVLNNERIRFGRTPGVEDIAKEQNDKSLTANIENFHKAWDNFMTALGGPGIKLAIPWLQQFTKWLNELNEWINNMPPEKQQMLFNVAAGLSALAIGLGGFIVAGVVLSTFTGIATGLTVLTTGIIAFSAALAPWVAGGVLAVTFSDYMDKLFPKPATGGPQKNALPVDPRSMGPQHTLPGNLPMPGDAEFKGPALAHKSSWITPPPSTKTPIQLTSNLILDGKQIASNTNYYNYRSTTSPASGPSSPGNRGLGPTPWFVTA